MKRIVFLILAAVLFACSNNDKDNLRLSVRGAYDGGLAKIKSHVSIDTAKILVTRIKLNDGAADMDFRSGPYVVVLTDTSLHSIAVGDVPQGSYNQVKFEIHKPDQNEDVPDPDFREGPGGNERYSMIVIGTYQGNRFVFKSRNTINQTTMIDPPILVEDSIGVANLTLRVDYDQWFLDGSVELDPTDTTSSNVAFIENGIRASFRAFRDDDGNGDPTPL